MKRKKTEEIPEDGEFWPIPGVDGVPYPELVQKALDAVEKETLRLKRLACKHTDRMFITGAGDHYGKMHYRRACRFCGQVVNCEHPKGAQTYKLKRNNLEFWECHCGKLIAKRPEVEPRLRTPIYGFEYERKTGTDWLKTEEQEQRAARTDCKLSRQLERKAESMVTKPSTSSAVVPLMLSLDYDPGTKPGRLENAMLEAIEKKVRELASEAKRAEPYRYRGPLGSSPSGFTIRNMAGDIILTGDNYDETERY